jgi:hypothetical protein
MAVMTGTCVLSAVLPLNRWGGGDMTITIITVALVVIIAGGLVTAWRRISWIAAKLREKAS